MLAHKEVVTLKGRTLLNQAWQVSSFSGISWGLTGSWELLLKAVELPTEIGVVSRFICELYGLFRRRMGDTLICAVHLCCGGLQLFSGIPSILGHSDICCGLLDLKVCGSLQSHLGSIFKWELLWVLCLKLVARSIKLYSCIRSEAW